ncbi:MAG: hypothetical protein FJ086_13880 [Deltaproteobacteria bacterium]|nr:hypothetical protein [Deltaproteobacteria bacterium]
MTPRVACLAFALLLATACGRPAPTWHGDVRPVVEGRCAGCHAAGGVAPFPLQDAAAVRAHAEAIVASVEARRMPPWQASEADVTYRENPSLTEAQVALFRQWMEAGMPEGDPTRPGAPLAPVSAGLGRVDLELALPTAYATRRAPDDYRCFPVDWPQSAPTYVTGFDALPGNPAIVHHLAVYLVPPDSAHLPAQWDAEEEGPGYTCYGGPSGGRDSTVPTLLLSAWIPGFAGSTLPDGLGILVPPGSRLVLQVHYNAAQPGAEDLTRVRFQLADAVQTRAVYAPWLKLDWVAGSMPIPAGTSGVLHQVVDDPRDFFKLFAPDFDFPNGFNVHSAMFHMHNLGRHGEALILKPGGERVRLLDIPRWDFHGQREYRFTAPAAFAPGDKVALRCTFDNPGATDVNWGEGTADEMCVVNLLVTPR